MGAVAFTGYSGSGAGKNNPAMQDVIGVGPIPQADYTIGPLEDSHQTGMDIMRLTPKPGSNVFGRSDFEMHGDSSAHPGMASHGCIIMAHAVRLYVAKSGDTDLRVTA